LMKTKQRITNKLRRVKETTWPPFSSSWSSGRLLFVGQVGKHEFLFVLQLHCAQPLQPGSPAQVSLNPHPEARVHWGTKHLIVTPLTTRGGQRVSWVTIEQSFFSPHIGVWQEGNVPQLVGLKVYEQRKELARGFPEASVSCWQTSVVHFKPSLQIVWLGAWKHWPPEQVSTVQGLQSSQSSGWVIQPNVGLQTATWQGLVAEQAVSSGVNTQPHVGSQESLVQSILSLQDNGEITQPDEGLAPLVPGEQPTRVHLSEGGGQRESRGVQLHWPLLQESEVQPILSLQGLGTSTQPTLASQWNWTQRSWGSQLVFTGLCAQPEIELQLSEVQATPSSQFKKIWAQ